MSEEKSAYVVPADADAAAKEKVRHGLLAAAVVAVSTRRRTESMIVGLLLLAKLAWEQWAGPLGGSEALAGGDVVVNAHLYGAVGGAVTAAILSVLPAARRL